MSYNGNTLAFQAEAVGSIPITCSTIVKGEKIMDILLTFTLAFLSLSVVFILEQDFYPKMGNLKFLLIWTISFIILYSAFYFDLVVYIPLILFFLMFVSGFLILIYFYIFRKKSVLYDKEEKTTISIHILVIMISLMFITVGFHGIVLFFS